MTTTLSTLRRPLALSVCLVALSMPPVSAQDRSRYRDYGIGDDVRTIAEQSGVTAPNARLIPLEPAALQELEWRAQRVRGSARPGDAVARITFGFYDDQLFRIVVDYDRSRTEGMTEADMVWAISRTYGPPSRRVGTIRAVGPRVEQAADLLVAWWDDTDSSVTLLRMPDSSAFRLIVASTRLGTLAEAAGAGAVQRDPQRDAPQRDVPIRSNDLEGIRSALEKARLANRADFQP